MRDGRVAITVAAIGLAPAPAPSLTCDDASQRHLRVEREREQARLRIDGDRAELLPRQPRVRRADRPRRRASSVESAAHSGGPQATIAAGVEPPQPPATQRQPHEEARHMAVHVTSQWFDVGAARRRRA